MHTVLTMEQIAMLLRMRCIHLAPTDLNISSVNVNNSVCFSPHYFQINLSFRSQSFYSFLPSHFSGLPILILFSYQSQNAIALHQHPQKVIPVVSSRRLNSSYLQQFHFPLTLCVYSMCLHVFPPTLLANKPLNTFPSKVLDIITY